MHGQKNIKHKRGTPTLSAGFEPSIPATKRPQTYANISFRCLKSVPSSIFRW